MQHERAGRRDAEIGRGIEGGFRRSGEVQSPARERAARGRGREPFPRNEGEEQKMLGVSNCYVFKSRLQEYAQKAGILTPVYETLKEGPSHEPCFRSTVIVNNVRYDSLPGFFNRKAAEQSAAEVALMELHKSGNAIECVPQPVHETGLCKNLLQEYAQKMNYAIPSYVCNRQTQTANSPFICTVEIGGIRYIGAAAKTKKEAEIKAARIALLAIQSKTGGHESNANSSSGYTVLPCKKKANEADAHCETAKPFKPKKAEFKKKARKNFRRKKGNLLRNGQKKLKNARKEDECVPVEGDMPQAYTDFPDGWNETFTSDQISNAVATLGCSSVAGAVDSLTPVHGESNFNQEEYRMLHNAGASSVQTPLECSSVAEAACLMTPVHGAPNFSQEYCMLHDTGASNLQTPLESTSVAEAAELRIPVHGSPNFNHLEYFLWNNTGASSVQTPVECSNAAEAAAADLRIPIHEAPNFKQEYCMSLNTGASSVQTPSKSGDAEASMSEFSSPNGQGNCSVGAAQNGTVGISLHDVPVHEAMPVNPFTSR